MSLNHSPKIVTDGLVFAYDTENKKSYKGPPIQNKISQITPRTQSGTGHDFIGGSEVVDIPSIGRTLVKTCQIQNNYSAVSTWCCPSPFFYGNVTVSGSTVYTYAIVYKVESNYTNANYMYRYEYNGGTYVLEQGLHNEGYRIHLGNGWYWAWRTFTTNTATTVLNSMASFYYRYSASYDKMSVANVLLVEGDYSGLHPKYWPAVNSTRSNTQAVLDLTGNNTITANSLTYNSDGSFEFNGTSDYATFGNSTAIASIGGTSNITVESWVKYDTYVGNGQSYSVVTHKGSPWTWLLENPSNKGRIRFTIGGVDTNCPDTSVHPLNTWIHWIGTYDGSNMKFYANGVLKNTVAATGTLGSNSTAATIGQYSGAYRLDGQISIVKVYNKALTAAEVQQNFNAHRGRYGI